eukprot:Clim_evm13s195 gene=Clim_evmTU13s195
MANSVRRTLTFVTGNKKKLEEVVHILNSNPSVHFDIDNKKIDLPELQGEPEEIARKKCQLAAQDIKGPVITEDTCLCFNALSGLPGPYIKWFLEKVGHDGLNRMLHGFEDKTAYALCTFAFTEGPGEEIFVFEGRTDGRIVPSRGDNNFGWDPIFEPEGFAQTYAEMDKDVKHTISHRRRALDAMRVHFEKEGQ